MLEPQDLQVGDLSLQAEAGRDWLMPILALLFPLSLSLGHFPYDLSHFSANLRVSTLPTSSGSKGWHLAQFGILGCAPATYSKAVLFCRVTRVMQVPRVRRVSQAAPPSTIPASLDYQGLQGPRATLGCR